MASSVYSCSVEIFEPRARSLIETHPQDDGTDDDNLTSSILSGPPKVTSKYNSFNSSSTTIKPEEVWTIREVANGEEQLYAKGKCVYWTRNSLIIKSFNFTDQVVRVFWAKFDGLDHVCVALNSGLSLFDRIGQHFQIILPFVHNKMYTTNLGLIIERQHDPSDDSSLPVLFALTHPTREISPVIFKPFTRTSQHNKVLTYSMPNFTSIVACHDSLPICCLFNAQDYQHSIWTIRSTTNEELDEFGKMNEDSTANTFAHHPSNCSFREGGISHSSLNLSSRQKSSLLHQSNQSSAATINFSPKIDLRNTRHSTMGNLAASRLGAGCAPTAGEINLTNIRSFTSAHTLNSLSTTNRNRVINYLRDNIEEPILPELTFEQIWSESSNKSTKGNKFFTTIDLIGDSFFVIVMNSSEMLKVIKVDKFYDENSPMVLGRASFIPALDAAPINSLKMMLVIDMNRNFVLYSGSDRITNLNIPLTQPSSLRPMPTSSPAVNKHTSMELSPIQMSSARKRSSLGDRSSIGSDMSFQQIFQTLSPVPHASKHDQSKTSSPVNSYDLKQIEHVIDRSIFVLNNNSQRVKIDIPFISQTLCVNRLIDAMKYLVPRELGITLVTRWYQTRRSLGQAELLSAYDELQLFKDWFLKSIGLESNMFSEDSDVKFAIRSSQSSPNKKSRRARDVELNPLMSKINTLFYAMHLVFEDLILMKLNYELAYSLAELLLVLACLLKLDDYQEYYWLKFPDLQKKIGKARFQLANLVPKVETFHRPIFFQTNPPSVMSFINNLITLARYESPIENVIATYPNIPGVTDHSFTVVTLFCDMFGIDAEKSIINLNSSPTNYIPTLSLSKKAQRSRTADERVVERLVKFGKNRNYLARLPEGLNSYLWDAVLNCRESPPSGWCESCFNLIGRMDLVNLVGGKSITTSISKSDDGEDETLKLIFPDDIRVVEAHRMLSSDTPVEFSVTQRPGATEEESRDETHRHLYLLNVRSMAKPVGRGAICLRTYSPVIGESFEVPPLELSGRLLSDDRPIEYSHDMSVYPWPFFHNGVAAGLTICASSANNIIDSTWINYNRPRSNIPHGADIRDRDLTTANINNEHAGFLFALGLNGHLEKLSLMALHDYLCQNNDLTKLAILLGMAAAKRGSRDTNIIKVLSIHVDALLPPNPTELDVPATVHAAAITGVGLLYQGSGDSHISRVLLEEIGRLPGPEANSHIDRESYSLSAGLAFGLVNLCQGGSSTISSSDQLRLYMLGGKRKTLTATQKERYFKQDCHRGEEEYINTHITSPGGTLGLGLMYHRSNNKSVANWMLAPDTQTLLEYVRPDFLIIRMLSYGIIMWDSVEPNEEYITSHIPKIVSTHAFQRNPVSASAGLASPTASNPSIDYELISQAYCNIVAGCCMAIAIRFAGTANTDAYKTIYKHTKMLIALSNKPSLAEQAGRPCIESCLNVLVTSLAIVMAGTGDLGVLRVCRYLRSRLTQTCVFYGSYMAVHVSLGILFLGACRYSLSTSPESIGALICALYPIYPSHSSDNRYHLQALRHLYVLAAEPRLLIPRDIMTNKPVYVTITVSLNKESKIQKQTELRLRAPCLVPEVDSIKSVVIDDEKYWRIEIKDTKTLIRCLTQNGGYLSVKQKADSSNNQLIQNIENHIIDTMEAGVMKSRKSSVLKECIKEDRVEQYSVLNMLSTRSHTANRRFKCLTMEQLHLTMTLADNNITNKINLLRPIVCETERELIKVDAERKWIDFVCKATDWTDTGEEVAYYVTLNDLKCSELGADFLAWAKSSYNDPE